MSEQQVGAWSSIGMSPSVMLLGTSAELLLSGCFLIGMLHGL